MKRIKNLSRATATAIADVLGTLSINRFSSQDKCKRELESFLKDDHSQNEAIFLRAVDFKKKEIQWIRLGIPSLLFGIIILYMIHGVISSPVSKYVFGGLVYIIALTIAFRLTFYQDYLDICKLLMLAAGDLLKDIRAREAIVPAKPMEEIPKPLFLNGQDQDLAIPVPPKTKTPSAEPVIVYGIELKSLFERNDAAIEKGRISLFLLDQLLRHECGRPCIQDGNIYKTIADSAFVSGCKSKNILNKFRYYRNRKNIHFETSNIQTTHLRYLEILQDFYTQIEDQGLCDQAVNLLSFITPLESSKKM